MHDKVMYMGRRNP